MANAMCRVAGGGRSGRRIRIPAGHGCSVSCRGTSASSSSAAILDEAASASSMWNGDPPEATATLMQKEERYGAHNTSPLPVAIARGRGVEVWDVEGKRYLDFMSAHSVVNQGHCHPRIVDALVRQASTLAIASRAVHNELLGEYEEYVTRLFGYDKMLAMNTGVEGGETAVKLARRWAYDVKGIEDGKATVVFPVDNFWGRTLGAISSSTNPACYSRFGPFMPGFATVPYNDLNALEEILSSDPNIAAFMVEPILGEAGVIVPDEGYMRSVAALCKRHNVLLIADEVQVGLGRAGAMLCCDHEGVRADIVVLGKALSGGMYPVSAVLADDDVMLTIKPGEHGSTYAGNPLACAVGKAALEVLVEEELPQRALSMEAIFRQGLTDIQNELGPKVLSNIRGRGLFFGVDVGDPDTEDREISKRVIVALRDRGIIVMKAKQKNALRLAPPLCVSHAQIESFLDAFRDALKEVIVGV